MCKCTGVERVKIQALRGNSLLEFGRAGGGLQVTLASNDSSSNAGGLREIILSDRSKGNTFVRLRFIHSPAILKVDHKQLETVRIQVIGVIGGCS